MNRGALNAYQLGAAGPTNIVRGVGQVVLRILGTASAYVEVHGKAQLALGVTVVNHAKLYAHSRASQALALLATVISHVRVRVYAAASRQSVALTSSAKGHVVVYAKATQVVGVQTAAHYRVAKQYHGSAARTLGLLHTAGNHVGHIWRPNPSAVTLRLQHSAIGDARWMGDAHISRTVAVGQLSRTIKVPAPGGAVGV